MTRISTSARALVVSLHDVSPRTATACAQILAQLAGQGVPRCSLLVIPDHHHRAPMLEDATFCAWLREQSAAGHEIVMHGYYHQRARRPGESARTRFTTRLYTADEGECYDLSRDDALALVAKARADFAQLGLAPPGFIAPAWLLSAEAEESLRVSGCDYTTRLGSVLDLPNKRTFHSQSLVWSVRSAWRRWTSLAWNALLFRRLAANPLLRISLHPVDLKHVTIWQQVGKLLTQALADRQPLTYHAWLAQWRLHASSSAPL